MKTVCAAGIVALSAMGLVNAGQGPWQQCGGIGWTGEGACVSGNTCTVINDYYWQCLPGTATPGTPTPGTTPTSAPPTATPSGCTVPKSGAGKVKYAGVNIAGFDFGCSTDGTCNTGGAYPPLASNGGPDGVGQMQHFFNDDKFNIFRLPVGWQWLVNNNLGGPLDANNFAKYDELVQECLKTGATCIIDIHNYARWNGQIIGQGGPTDDQFASLWSNLATEYKANDKVIFGLMNEPHDVPDINRWGQTMQTVVTAIRKAGATTNLILLPGNNWTSAAAFISSGSADALHKVTNPDGSKTSIAFDVHKYSDNDNSGTHTECVTDNIDSAFRPLAEWLRCNGRQALNTEMGGGNTASCAQYICQQVKFVNENSDVYLGYVGWAAGSFATSYELSLTPTFQNGRWSDSSLLSSCLKPQ